MVNRTHQLRTSLRVSLDCTDGSLNSQPTSSRWECVVPTTLRTFVAVVGWWPIRKQMISGISPVPSFTFYTLMLIHIYIEYALVLAMDTCITNTLMHFVLSSFQISFCLPSQATTLTSTLSKVALIASLFRKSTSFLLFHPGFVCLLGYQFEDFSESVSQFVYIHLDCGWPLL